MLRERLVAFWEEHGDAFSAYWRGEYWFLPLREIYLGCKRPRVALSDRIGAREFRVSIGNGGKWRTH